MKYLHFKYCGVSRFINPDDTKEIQKLYKLGYRPVTDKAGNFVFKEMRNVDVVNGVEDNEVINLFEKLANQLKNEAVQAKTPVGSVINN